MAGAAESTLSGVLADPLSDGLDELPFKFAQTLQQLAADALASELFDIIGGLFSGGGAAGGGTAVHALATMPAVTTVDRRMNSRRESFFLLVIFYSFVIIS